MAPDAKISLPVPLAANKDAVLSGGRGSERGMGTGVPPAMFQSKTIGWGNALVENGGQIVKVDRNTPSLPAGVTNSKFT